MQIPPKKNGMVVTPKNNPHEINPRRESSGRNLTPNTTRSATTMENDASAENRERFFPRLSFGNFFSVKNTKRPLAPIPKRAMETATKAK